MLADKLKNYAYLYSDCEAIAAINDNARGGSFLLSGEDGAGLAVLARIVAVRLCGLSDDRAFDDLADIVTYPIPPERKKSKTKKGGGEREATATVSADDVRDIVGSLYLTPFELKRRIYIIESAETMSEICQNKLLKSLEEPPEAVRFILCASGRLLPTVESRCTRIELPPFPVETVAGALSRFHRDGEAVMLAARASRGNLGMAESILADPGFADGYFAAKRILSLANGSRNFAKTAAVYEKLTKERLDSVLGLMEFLLADIAVRLSGGRTVFDEGDVDGVSFGFTPMSAALCAEHVRLARRHLSANGMPSAVMDTLILKIMEEKAKCRK